MPKAPQETMVVGMRVVVVDGWGGGWGGKCSNPSYGLAR